MRLLSLLRRTQEPTAHDPPAAAVAAAVGPDCVEVNPRSLRLGWGYAATFAITGYPATVAAWAERNGCGPEPTDTEVTSEVVHRVYDCPAGADVEFYIVLGGGHSWPSSEFSESIGDIVGKTTFDIDATRDAWAFLSQFRNDTASS